MKEGHIAKENSNRENPGLYIYIYKTPAYPFILCILTHANCNM